VMNIRTADLLDMTMRELFVRQEAYIMDRWNHTARITTYLQNIAVMIASFGSKKKMPLSTVADEHPLLGHKKQNKGMRITPENFDKKLRPMFANGRH